MKTYSSLIFISLIFLFISCGSSTFSFDWEVNAIGNTPENKTYFSESRFPEDTHPLLVKEYMSILDTVMKKLGYEKMDTSIAALKVVLGYKFGEKSVRSYINSTPVYHYQPSTTTLTNANTTIVSPTGNSLGTVSTTASQTNPGSIVYAGQNTTTSYSVTQEFKVSIDAFETSNQQPVFSVCALHTKVPGEFVQKYIRYFVAMGLLSMEPYIGKDTGAFVKSPVKDDDLRKFLSNDSIK